MIGDVTMGKQLLLKADHTFLYKDEPTMVHWKKDAIFEIVGGKSISDNEIFVQLEDENSRCFWISNSIWDDIFVVREQKFEFDTQQMTLDF